LTRAANLTLGGQQDAVFQELDSLLRGATDRKQHDFVAKLESEIAKTLQSVAIGRKQAQRSAWCEDLREGRSDPKKVFEELDTITGKADPRAVPSLARFGVFESEMQGLLRKVASESELLARQFPLEEVPEEPPPARSRDIALAVASPGDRGPGPEPKVLEELGMLLDAGGDAVADHHRRHAATLAAQMTHFVGGVQQRRTDTHEFVTRLLKGEEDHPVDREDAAWRRSTLEMLQSGGFRPKLVSKVRRKTVGMAGAPAAPQSAMRRSSATTAAPPRRR